jgi:DNA-binding NtrC family response regulator
VRELRNELERVYAERPVEIGAGSLFRRDRPEGDDQGSLAPQGPPAVFRSLREVRESAERDLILRTLEAYGGNASTAARKLKVTRRYLGTLIKKYGIRLQAVKGGFGGEAPPAE